MHYMVQLQEHSYPIYIERNQIEHLKQVLDTKRNLMIITDDGVPRQWVNLVSKQCPNSFVVTFKQGEASKNFETYQFLLKEAIQHKMTRTSAIVALGGGVVGDLAGFVAATYMRGIDFYNIPTTLLSQVDSSVGGKVAIDMDSYKNVVGTFWQPKAVVIDPNVLTTLSDRQINNGLIEALKAGLIQDAELVKEFEKEKLDIDTIIARSIQVKQKIVQEDERELNIRKCLNFGHTIGHAIEGAYGFRYLHGECVALGLLFFLEDKDLKKRVKKILARLHMPEMPAYDPETLMSYIQHDKKGKENTITICRVQKAGSYLLEDVSYDTIYELLERKVYEE